MTNLKDFSKYEKSSIRCSAKYVLYSLSLYNNINGTVCSNSIGITAYYEI